MSQLRILGAGMLVLTGIASALGLRRRRRPTADDLMKMDEREFAEHIRSIGMEQRVRAALSRIDRGEA